MCTVFFPSNATFVSINLVQYVFLHLQDSYIIIHLRACITCSLQDVGF